MAFDYPIMLDLTGVPVLVVGGGRIALRKVEGLLKARCRGHRGRPESADRRSARCRFESSSEPYESDDLDRVRLVITATDDPAVNAAVAADATARGIWVNSADDPANCTFTLPAVARDGDVTVAVSTGGASPALASHLRGEIEMWLGRDRCRRCGGRARRAAREMQRRRGVDRVDRLVRSSASRPAPTT